MTTTILRIVTVLAFLAVAHQTDAAEVPITAEVTEVPAAAGAAPTSADVAAGVGAASTDCTPTDVHTEDQATADLAASLLAQGWTGHADDGMEALYAPGC